MSRAIETRNEINRITAKLIEIGLSDDQNYAILKNVSAVRSEVSFQRSAEFSSVLRNAHYEELYHAIKKNRDYNISLVDGGLLQLQYTFDDDEIVKQRLGFFPSPDLSEFQNSPEIYEHDLIYAEIIGRKVVTTPIRFDFDREAFVEDDHPMSHLTIGQYKNCRIPIRSAVSPYRFFEFILGAFYNTAFRSYRDEIGTATFQFATTITTKEAQRIHIALESING